MKKLLVLGPGHSLKTMSSDIKERQENYSVLAFQRTFPHCMQMFDIEPDYWTAADPYAFLEGMKYIIEQKKQLKTKILVPDIFTTNTATFRAYFGTSPLLREKDGWQVLQDLLEQVKNYCSLEILPITTTKFLSKQKKPLPGSIFGENPFYRFMHEKVIIGSIPFDSEQVVGTQFKWGLENKLSSAVFPVCSYLRASELYVVGFDMFGPRFYSDDARHPWNDQTQKGEVIQIPLGIIKMWKNWENLHQMKIFSASNPKETLLSKVLETREL
tara:strand:+ start:274 stop:1086 length:813 start_codon:yes stop_codon:yes gene_type:complete